MQNFDKILYGIVLGIIIIYINEEASSFVLYIDYLIYLIAFVGFSYAFVKSIFAPSSRRRTDSISYNSLGVVFLLLISVDFLFENDNSITFSILKLLLYFLLVLQMHKYTFTLSLSMFSEKAINAIVSVVFVANLSILFVREIFFVSYLHYDNIGEFISDTPFISGLLLVALVVAMFTSGRLHENKSKLIGISYLLLAIAALCLFGFLYYKGVIYGTKLFASSVYGLMLLFIYQFYNKRKDLVFYFTSLVLALIVVIHHLEIHSISIDYGFKKYLPLVIDNNVELNRIIEFIFIAFAVVGGINDVTQFFKLDQSDKSITKKEE